MLDSSEQLCFTVRYFRRMIEPSKRHDVEMGSERSFGVVFAVVFAIFALWPLTKGVAPRLWALVVALVFLALAFVWPAVLRPLNLVWFRLGLLLSAVVTPTIMALLYVIAVIPMGLALRLMKKDLLGLKREPDRASYWMDRDTPGPERGTMKRQF